MIINKLTPSHEANHSPNKPLQFSGVVPSLSMKAKLGLPRSECAPGAMMAWADRLWVVNYVSHKSGSGVGMGFYEIDENLHMTRRPESYVGTYTNRMVHFPSNQLIIGPYVIDALRKVRRVESLLEVRLCSIMQHLTDPKNKVYLLGMEGEFFEMDVHSLQTRLRARSSIMNTIFATGWDRASALLKVFTCNDMQWTTYRLPKASHTFDHAWQTEWSRIRETEHERFLMDCHGMFYELSPWAYSGKVWGGAPHLHPLVCAGRFLHLPSRARRQPL